ADVLQMLNSQGALDAPVEVLQRQRRGEDSEPTAPQWRGGSASDVRGGGIGRLTSSGEGSQRLNLLQSECLGQLTIDAVRGAVEGGVRAVNADSCGDQLQQHPPLRGLVSQPLNRTKQHRVM